MKYLTFALLWSCVFSDNCTTPSGRISQCISLYMCPELLAAYEQRPLPSEVVDFLRKSLCRFDGFVAVVCCGPVPQQLSLNTIHTSTSQPIALRRENSVNPTDSNPTELNWRGFDNGGCKYQGQIMNFYDFSRMLLLGPFSESCTTPTGRISQCISLNKCPALLAAFEQRPLPSEVVDFLRRSQCGFEGYIPMVCCGPIPQQTNTNTTPRPTSRPTIPGGEDPVNPTDSYPMSRDKCGFDNGDRIYGGQITDLDEFTWMALLGYKPSDSNDLTYQCGGVLINARYILSAAHCVVGEIETAVGQLATARLGEYDTQNDIDCLNKICADPILEVRVHSAYPHPGFSDKNKNRKDDISVIRLAKRVKFTDYIQPICLVDTRQRMNSGDHVFVAGWGKTLNGKSSPIKLKLQVPIFSKNDCVGKYRGLGAELTDNQVCAGGVFAEDACRGDSGGPLMRMSTSGTWESVGIVSFGYGCGRDGWPGVYTSVANYVDWIKRTMRDSNV